VTGSEFHWVGPKPPNFSDHITSVVGIAGETEVYLLTTREVAWFIIAVDSVCMSVSRNISRRKFSLHNTSGVSPGHIGQVRM